MQPPKCDCGNNIYNALIEKDYVADINLNSNTPIARNITYIMQCDNCRKLFRAGSEVHEFFMPKQNNRCKLCDNVVDIKDTGRFTEIGWVCPPCYPNYEKTRTILKEYYFDSIRRQINRMLEL